MTIALFRMVSLLVVVIASSSLFLGCTAADGSAARTKEVIDAAGRKVMIPERVSKVATMQGPTYEMVFALGAKKQIGFVRADHKTAYPLAKLTNPDLPNYRSDIKQVGPQVAINIEEFINAKPDLVLYWNVKSALEQFETAGIPAIVLNWSTANPQNVDEAVADKKRQMRVLADALGGDAIKRYERWAKYYDESVAFARARLASVPAEKRLKVYIGNSWGSNPLSTWGKDSGAGFNVEAAGGLYVAKEVAGGQFPEVSMEQVISWAPDVIFIDNHGRDPDKVIANIKSDPNWSVVPAVKNGRVYRIPSAVFFLDKGTTVPLYILWAGKTLYPEQFADLDLVKEMKTYFKEFYDYNLSNEEAERALRGWNE